MRVAKVERFGGPEVLMAAEMPDPLAGPGQVVVRVTAADVLFVETVVRRGEGGGYFPVKPPYVPGGAVAGQVISVAKGVEPSWIGQRVVAGMAGGGYAQQAIALVADLVPIPDGLGMDEAVALFHDGRTALGLLEATGAHAGESVLVTAAAGGLGILLVQRARSSGAHVVAAARGQAKLRLVRELGAETVVDYSEPDWTTRVREATGGTGPDVVFDGAGGQIGRAAFEITRPGGRFSAHGTASGAFADVDPKEAERRGITVRGIEQVQFTSADMRRLVVQVLSDAASGQIRPVIGQRFSLEHAADAHAAIEARDVIGKTLLVI